MAGNGGHAARATRRGGEGSTALNENGSQLEWDKGLVNGQGHSVGAGAEWNSRREVDRGMDYSIRGMGDGGGWRASPAFRRKGCRKA